jgi:hypothetical protein
MVLELSNRIVLEFGITQFLPTFLGTYLLFYGAGHLLGGAKWWRSNPRMPHIT